MAAAFIVQAFIAGVFTTLADVTEAPIRISRTFQSDAPDDLVSAPATLAFSLDNSIHNAGGVVGYYSPDSASKYVGWLTGILVRVRSTANGNTRTIFYGWLESITPHAGVYDDHVVDCTAVGWLNQAATASIAGLATATAQRGDQLVTALVAVVPNAPAATSFATSIDTYPYGFRDLNPETSTVLDGLDSACKSGFDRVFEKADGTLRFESRKTRQSYAVPVQTITDAAPGGSPGNALAAFGLSRARGRRVSRVQVTTHPPRIDASPVILYALQLSGSSPFIEAGQTLTLQLPYVDPSQQAQSVAGFAMIDDGAGHLPSADYKFTSAASGGGSDLSASVVVGISFGPTQAIATITNNNGVRAYYNKLQVRGQGIYAYQTVTGTKTSTAAQTAIGQNVLSCDCPYNADPIFAQSAATYLATLVSADVSYPDAGCQVFVHAGDEVTMDLFLQREISDPIALTETVTGITAGAYWINGVTIEIDERNNVLFTFAITPNLAGIVWTLGVAGASELGSTTLLGF